MGQHKFDNLTIPDMLKHLDVMYQQKENIQKIVEKLYKEYEQLCDDIEMAEMIIMHQSNAKARKNEPTNLFGNFN